MWPSSTIAQVREQELSNAPDVLGGHDHVWLDYIDGRCEEAIEFYKKAFIDLDAEALGGDQMKEAFTRLAKLRTYVDDNFSGRDWNLATAMVINGQAGVWTKWHATGYKEFETAGRVVRAKRR